LRRRTTPNVPAFDPGHERSPSTWNRRSPANGAGTDSVVAIYRLSAQIVKRSAGRSVTAAAAYRAGIAVPDARSGQTFDYTRRQGVVHTEILVPPDTPDWMLDRAQLWNAVEAAEKRKDAQLARELQLALPHELSAEQRLALALDFVRAEFVARGMIADVAVHLPDRRGDERNHHAHVLLTLRVITGDGFGPKAREWNDTAMLEGWRSAWSEATNRALASHGHAERVDHRSYAAQGVDREAEPKMGPVATTMERQGHPSHAGADRRAAQARNRRRSELLASLVGIVAELEASDFGIVTPVPVPKTKKTAGTVPAGEPFLASVPETTPEPPPARQQKSAGWKQHLLALWATVARAVTGPVRALAATTKRRRHRRRRLTPSR
jgi:hypothetical protein